MVRAYGVAGLCQEGARCSHASAAVKDDSAECRNDGPTVDAGETNSARRTSEPVHDVSCAPRQAPCMQDVKVRSGNDPSEGAAAVLGRNLRRLRSDAAMTQAAVAERTGIARAHYGALESGLSSNGTPGNPRLSTLLDLAAALGTTLEELLEGVDSGRPRSAVRT